MYVLLLKQLLADIGITDQKMTGKLCRPELHVTLVKRLWNDLNLAWHKLCWLHCWCYSRLNHPPNIELRFSDVIVSWESQDQTSLYAFWVGTSRISLEGSVFSHCQSSWEEGDSGVENEDSSNMPWTKMKRKLPLLFHFIGEVGCEFWESRKAQEYFICGRGPCHCFFLSTKEMTSWGIAQQYLSDIGSWREEVDVWEYTEKGSNHCSILSMVYPIANTLFFLVNSTMLSSGIGWSSSGEVGPVFSPKVRNKFWLSLSW